LDFYLETTDEPEIEDWIEGLVSLGYRREAAIWRLGVRCKTFKKPLDEVYTFRCANKSRAHHSGNMRALFGRRG
jgi:hypothetical protein